MKNKKIGIIGGGRFGMTLAESLSANDVDVTLLDKSWEVIQSLSNSTIRAIHGDGTNPDKLREAGFADCDVAVIAIASSLESSTLATINCKDLKIRRVIAKAEASAPHEVLLVLDGTIGQNAIAQVKAFDKAIGVSGLVITKLDGSAKGGVLAAIACQCPKPVRYVGVGEQVEDLQPFTARAFAEALLGQ